MPICFFCKNPNVPLENLKSVHLSEPDHPFKNPVMRLICPECLFLYKQDGPDETLTQTSFLRREFAVETQEPVFSFQVREVEQHGEKDFTLSATLRSGGVSLEFTRTVGQIREFFTGRREKLVVREGRQP